MRMRILLALACAALMPVSTFAHDARQRTFEPDAALKGQQLSAGPVIPGIEPGALAAIQLTAEQRRKLTDIERDLQRTQWRFVGAIREARWKQQDALKTAEVDAASVLRLHDEVAALKRQYFEAALAARKSLESILTKEQRLQLFQYAGRSDPGPRAADPAADRRPP